MKTLTASGFDPDALLRPKAPRGSTGHVQRVEILRLLLGSFGVTWTPSLSEKLLSRIDWTDAAVSAALAALRARSATQGVGDATEGTIVIANPAELGGLASSIRDAVSGLGAKGHLTARPSTRWSPVVDDADCALLRLGGAGLGVLTPRSKLCAVSTPKGRLSFPSAYVALPIGGTTNESQQAPAFPE